VQGTVTGVIDKDGVVQGVTYNTKVDGSEERQTKVRMGPWRPFQLTVVRDKGGERLADGDLRWLQQRAAEKLCRGEARRAFGSHGWTEMLTRRAQAASHFYGIVLKTGNLPFPNHGHVILAHPAPVLMYPVREGGFGECGGFS
jgi:hypothetical protein